MGIRGNYEGVTYGMLTVLSYSSKTRKCICKCACGSVTEKWTSNVVSGKTLSCGCDRLNKIRSSCITHGLTHSTEYKSWTGIIDRCCNPKQRKYAMWGGRGITVCDEWRGSFEAFLRDMGPKPSPSHSIDRYPDNDGPYCAGNCRWATKKEQARNTRRNRYLTIGGETLTFSEWAERKGVDVRRIVERKDRGWSDWDALNKPAETLAERSERVAQDSLQRWADVRASGRKRL